MYGYKISFTGVPKPVWGCETIITNYNWEGPHYDNRIEISTIKAPYLVRMSNNNTKNIYENTYALTCGIASEPKKCYSHPETQISMTSVAVEFDNLKIITKDLSIDDCADHNSILLPSFLDSINTELLDEFSISLHKYIMHNERNSEHDKITCYSIIYNLLAQIDSYVRNLLSHNIKTTYNHYVKKVNSIIHERYSSKLTEPEIARELGISSGYLSAMYKKTTGKTITEYLLATRMRKAETLLENYNMPTSKIASAVGFDDENYFRKKFKQHFGINIKEYKNIKRGNTLYHGKPTKT